MLVRLTDSWREVLQRRAASTDAWRELLSRREPGSEYAPELRNMLGEMSAAAVLMQANIKFNGALVLQMFGDGPVKLAVAEVQPDLAFRTTAKVVGEVVPHAQVEAMLNVNGQGRCAITLDPKTKFPGQTPYQGVVSLHGDQREPLQKISEVLEHYMLQSEQLDTCLILAANDDTAAGLLIQRVPVEGAGNLGQRNEDEIGRNEDYKRLAMLAATLTRDELLTLDADTLLRRLFWEENLKRFPPQTGEHGPRFACSCSRERVGRMLISLGRPEVDDIVVEQGRAEIGCDFCGIKYHFDAVDVGELFTPTPQQAPGSAAIN